MTRALSHPAAACRRAVAALLLTAGTAAAQTGCNDTIVTVTDWSISAIDDRTNLLETTLILTSGSPVRLIDGSVRFRDVLGGSIASFAIDRDTRLIPDVPVVQSGRWGPSTFERLLDLNPADVVVTVCVRGIVRDDGEVVEY